MAIQGTGLSDKNVRLRFFMFIFMGIIAFGAILYWRDITLTSAEYVEPPIKAKRIINSDNLHSQNYELEVIETTPAAR